MRIGTVVGQQVDGSVKSIFAGPAVDARRIYKSATEPKGTFKDLAAVHYFDQDGSAMRKRLESPKEAAAKAKRLAAIKAEAEAAQAAPAPAG